MPDYRFLIQSEQSASPAPINNSPTDLAVISPDDVSGGSDALGGAVSRAERFITAKALSPLNSATGGLATPAFKLGKAVATGASAGAIAGAGVGLVMAAVQFGINQINKVIEKNKAEAAAMTERDNMLLRAGSKTFATNYSGSFFGVKGINRS